MNHLKQLQLCWHMYTMDNNGRLVPNHAQTPIATTDAESWASGGATIDVARTNVQRAAMFPYNTSIRMYHCPSDKSTVAGTSTQRFRSYSMVHPWMSGGFGESNWQQVSRRESDIHDPDPSQASVLWG